MTPKPLILTPFRKALASLDKALEQVKNEFVRDATIQRFEYTYELARKMIERHFLWVGASEVRSLARRELFREAARVGLIDEPETWFDYNEARNKTSHTYNEAAAEEIYEKARLFARDAHRLLEELEKHHGRPAA
ncbi:MAG TPA: nucleotidyltransferase substrate binding protein [Thermoanaerobaculia bacterium]|jgi:nucleotidyltransferase substrate binding protein (TIGR01987 family)|nr:nucleotidyltransferase substrate binding protein [Thermoanaerobaculia bacterium]